MKKNYNIQLISRKKIYQSKLLTIIEFNNIKPIIGLEVDLSGNQVYLYAKLNNVNINKKDFYPVNYNDKTPDVSVIEKGEEVYIVDYPYISLRPQRFQPRFS